MSQVVHLPGLVRPRPRRPLGVVTSLAAALLAALALAGSASAAPRTFAGISLVPGGSGYVLMSHAGEAYAFGMPYRGGPRGFSGRIVSVSATAGGRGYVAVSSTGQVYAYGNVVHRGNPTGFYAFNTRYHGNPVGFRGVSISTTADASGYYAISSSGQVYAYGTAYLGNGDPGSPDPPSSGMPPLLSQSQIRGNRTPYGACTASNGTGSCPTVRLADLQMPASFRTPSRTVKVNAFALEALRRVVVDIDRAGLRRLVTQFQVVNRRQCRRVGGGYIPGCVSLHSWGIAVDVNPGQLDDTRDGRPLAGVRRIFQSHGFVWGATFRSNVDPPHFQYATI